MKTSIKLVVVALALVVLACFAASCDMGGTPAATTTAPVTTTEAVTTTVVTTTVAAQKTDLSANITMNDKTTDFTSRPINVRVYQVSGMNTSVLKAEYSFTDAQGNVSTTAPTNVGTYTVTATFSFKAEDYANDYILPAPKTCELTIEPVDAQTIKAFGFQGVNNENKASGYYFDGCEYKLVVGELPVGLSVSYTMYKVDPSTGMPYMPPQIVPNDPDTGIPTATEAGIYKIVATFTDANGNYTADSYAKMEAYLTVKENPNQVLMYTPEIDGELDGAYELSANFAITKDTTADPESACIFTRVGGTTEPVNFEPTATVYYLWDGEYVYVCMVVNDPTFYSRVDGYVRQPDPWKNDSAEIYYYFGGTEQPIPTTTNIYPTYSAFTTDSVGRGEQDTALAATNKGLTCQNLAEISAVPAQRSAYFNEIICATTHTTANQGEAYQYIVEMAIPAKSETLRNGQSGETVGNTVIFKDPGAAITAGEFGWVCVQINDLFNIPSDLPQVPECDKYTDVINKVMSDEWKAYDNRVTDIICYSNRQEPAHFNCIQFSDVAAQ